MGLRTWWHERKALRVQAWYLFAIKPRLWESERSLRRRCREKMDAITVRADSEIATTHRLDWSQPGGVRRVPR